MARLESGYRYSQEKHASRKGEPVRSQKKKRLKIAAVGVSAALALGVGGGIAYMSEAFSSQTYIAKSITEQQAITLKHDLTVTLKKDKLLGDPKKPLPVEVITFNTASGNRQIKTPQNEFVDLPFYQKVIKGEPDAPIIGLQEAGPEQMKALDAYKKDGNFSYMYIKADSSPAGDLLVVPKRFEVLENHSARYSIPGQIKSVFESVVEGNLDPSQVMPRMYTQATLKDKLSGETFTLFNTHLCFVPAIHNSQEKELFAKIKEAEKSGSVLLTGDLNADNRAHDSRGKAIKHDIADAGMTDMGKSHYLKGRGDIDYVLAKGFNSIKSENIFQLSLPGSPTAEQVSDHYAQAAWVQLDK